MQTNKDKQVALMASFAVALMLVAMPLIFAEENDTNESVVTIISNSSNDEYLDDVNQTLDDDILEGLNDDLNESVSGWDITRAKVGLWFTLNQEKKAEKELKLARMELVRARNFAKNNNTVAMEKAIEAHNRFLEKVGQRIDSLNGDSSGNGAKESGEKLVGLQRAIEVHKARIQRLNDIIADDWNLTEEQIANLQQRIAKAENMTFHLEDIQEAKRERIKTKMMAVGNLSEEEAEDELIELEDEHNLSAVKLLIVQRRISEYEEHLEEFKKEVSEAQADGKNVTSANEMIVLLEARIAEAKILMQQGKYDEAANKLGEFKDYKEEYRKEFKERAKEQLKENRQIAKEQFKDQKERVRNGSMKDDESEDSSENSQNPSDDSADLS